ncbi:galactose mutarotase-like protein [Parathielavia appendiculata]|uniref:Galactose mutarotase-like protein n=1 Tax=Parathielavia appendiculata TaxID=2587402 RepID=A0AAN6TSG8_9PEZI|nr:galactose mutarotase-like protein [Parathielavia appendiculata]
MVELRKLSAGVLATAKAVWKGGSPFAALTAMWPVNDEGKYTIEAEGIKISFTHHGAAVANLWVRDRDGDEIDIVLGLDHADMYPETSSNPYLNGVIGRYAGYIRDAGYEAEGVKQQLLANAHGGTATFNGGEKSWGRLDWAVPSNEKDSITFVMFDKGKNGFPGLFVGCVTHTVSPYTWHIGYGVTPLLLPGGPLNMAQQAFFNLNGLRRTDNGTIGSVTDHYLYLPMSGMRFHFDENGISTGNILSNPKGKEHDFWSSPKTVGKVLINNSGELASSYDQTFTLAHKYADSSRRQKPAAILSSSWSGITMEVYTDQDALRVHTWSEEQTGPLRLKKSQGEGEVPRHGAISLEQSDWPDAVNHPEWMNRKTLWGNLDIYSGYMEYKFKVNGGQVRDREL